MITKLVLGSVMAIGLTVGGFIWAGSKSGSPDCCAQALSFCEEGAACCQTAEKKDCCELGKDCCVAGAECCLGAPACCRANAPCCTGVKACCGSAGQDCCTNGSDCCASGTACCAK